MDQGWAALIAAVTAGVVGLWVGRRTVRDQAQVEHGQWLRNQRQEAYVRVLDTWDTALRSLEEIVDGAEERKRRHEREVETSDGGVMFFEYRIRAEVERASGPVNEALERVRLLGPDAVEKAAKNLEDALQGLGGAIRAHTGEEEVEEHWPDSAFWHEARRNATGCRRDFFDLARAVTRTAPDTKRRKTQ